MPDHYWAGGGLLQVDTSTTERYSPLPLLYTHGTSIHHSPDQAMYTTPAGVKAHAGASLRRCPTCTHDTHSAAKCSSATAALCWACNAQACCTHTQPAAMYLDYPAAHACAWHFCTQDLRGREQGITGRKQSPIPTTDQPGAGSCTAVQLPMLSSCCASLQLNPLGLRLQCQAAAAQGKLWALRRGA